MNTPNDLKIACEMLSERDNRIQELNSINAELVEALEAIQDYNSRAPYGCLTTELRLMTDAVLAKAKNLV